MPTHHAVFAVAYRLYSGAANLVFTGDTPINDAFWDIVNDIENLRYLIIETAFSNHERDIDMLSKICAPVCSRKNCAS